MRQLIGQIQALYRYPIKSMAGERIAHALLGWHGIAGDRRYALRRRTEQSGFPWLTASRLPALLRYQPFGRSDHATEPLPTHVRTPDARVFALDDAQLAAEIGAHAGSEVELMWLNHGMFDESPVSLLSTTTVAGIQQAANRLVDVRRFRPNIVIAPLARTAFVENAWVGGTLVFGASEDAAAVAITQRDKRCAMVNIDPDTAEKDPAIMRAVVALNENNAGVYGTVVRAGMLEIGVKVFLQT